MQESVFERKATPRQINYLKGLEEKGKIRDSIDFENLSAKQASEILSSIVGDRRPAARKPYDPVYEPEIAGEIRPGVRIDRKQPINGVRLGMAIKLVYANNGHNVNAKRGADRFKKDVKKLYVVLEEIESEMSA